MVALGVVHAWWGVWARVFPRHFYDTFPGFGRRGTAASPPYNDHLVTDLGATFLTLAFLLLAGAASGNRSVRTLALVAVAVFGALHLSFHAGHPGTLTGMDTGASLFFLALGVLVPVALAVIDLRWSPPDAGMPGWFSRRRR
jgi:hypothetical protein